jgi:hypothetical protein
MVRSDQRGKKWFVRLGRANCEHASSGGLKAVFGFPNRNSYPGLARSLEWHRIATLRNFYFRSGYRRVWGPVVDSVFKLGLGTVISLRAFVLRFLVRDAHVVVTQSVPEALADLLEEILDYEVLSVWKNLEYLQWRYERHPEHRYMFHVLYVSGLPQGIAVTRDDGATAAICELIHRTKDVRQAAILLNRVLSYHSQRGSQRVEFYGHDDGFFDAVFTQCGFRSSYETSFVFSGHVYGDAALEQRFPVPSNWTVVYGDTDVV